MHKLRRAVRFLFNSIRSDIAMPFYQFIPVLLKHSRFCEEIDPCKLD